MDKNFGNHSIDKTAVYTGLAVMVQHQSNGTSIELLYCQSLFFAKPKLVDSNPKTHQNQNHTTLKTMMNSNITLTETEQDDLNAFFQFQLNEEATYLAAFTPKDPSDKTAYMNKYTKHLADPTIHMRTIKANGAIAGSIAKFLMGNEAEITYWIDRQFWGQGIATTALTNFLKIEPARPIYGRTAFDNHGSQKVLEKCGFIKIGKDKGFANARQAEIEEFIYRLSH